MGKVGQGSSPFQVILWLRLYHVTSNGKWDDMSFKNSKKRNNIFTV
jgi:hypothetical protein